MTTITIPGGSGNVPLQGTLIVDGPVGPTDTITFYHAHRGGGAQSGTLIINNVATFQGRVRNYFNLTEIRFVDPVTSVVVDTNPGDPPPFNGYIPALVKVFIGETQVTSFVIEPTVGDGYYSNASFTLAGGEGGMVFTTSHPRCFAAGTRLPTARGEVAVEDIRAGDAMPTALGRCWRRVRWVGHRRVRVAHHPRPWDVAPVRIRAGAFGPGQPRIDLVLSPDHAIHLAGRLIPVRYLLNGATVVQEEVDEITYHHVELADARGEPIHDTILAAGLPVETFLDTGGRADFANGGSVVRLVPDFARKVWFDRACAPLVIEGPHLVAARWQALREAGRLGWRLEDDAAPRLVAGGRTLLPERHDDTLRFRLPPRTRRARLVSRTFVPAHVQPDSSDHRALGLGIAHLGRDGAAVAVHDMPAADGWHEAEPDCRWTTGETAVDCAGARVLDVVLARRGRYWAQREAAQARTA